jgi:hypothetical protein
MSDELLTGQEPDDVSGWLPHDADAEGGEPPPPSLAGFSYIGRGLTRQEFTDYIAEYNFGPVKPDFVILHHTAIPTLADWKDKDISGNDRQTHENRRKKLERLKNVYEQKGWRSGPHLFIDDRWIWLFSEMSEFGTHAKWGNSFRNNRGLHYSIGIEVVGDYTRQKWNEPVADLVGFVVTALQRQLGTFELKYIDNKPARVRGIDEKGNPAWVLGDKNKLVAGGISSHRDYNKPACPGEAITDHYYMEIITGHQATQTAPHQPGFYVVSVNGASIWESPRRTGGTVALGGTAQLSRGTELEIDSFTQGESINGNTWWGHLKNQIGFVSMTIVKPKS